MVVNAINMIFVIEEKISAVGVKLHFDEKMNAASVL